MLSFRLQLSQFPNNFNVRFYNSKEIHKIDDFDAFKNVARSSPCEGSEIN